MSMPWMRVVGAALAVVVGAVGVACGPMIELVDGTTSGDPDEGTTNATSPPGTTLPPGTATSPPPPSTTAMPPPPDDTTEGPNDTGISFVHHDDGGWGWGNCDLFEQDCPRGEKCMPWAIDGGHRWNATRCSPVDGAPAAVGEPCVVEAYPTSGTDNCDDTSMCWDVDLETLEGTCVAFCIGSAANPSCEDQSATCVMSGSSVLALCLSGCDPVLQDCGDGHGCYPVDAHFMCVPLDGGAGGLGEPCEFINACTPGLLCAQAAAVPECPGLGCCTPFCDLEDPMPPCLPGQVCTSWYEPGMAPAGYEQLGACTLPPA